MFSELTYGRGEFDLGLEEPIARALVISVSCTVGLSFPRDYRLIKPVTTMPPVIRADRTPGFAGAFLCLKDVRSAMYESAQARVRVV
jgi:hypothetical protein